LDALAARPEVTRIELAPIAEEHWPKLVRQVLGLDDALARAVEQRAAGNPGYALALVEGLVRRGALVRGEHGLCAESGATIELPTSLRKAWDRAAEELLADGGPAARSMVIAALLGDGASLREWRRACTIAEVAPDERWLARARERHVVRCRGDRIHFVHAAMREAVIRAARAGGRLESLHLACARMLAEDGGAPDRARRLASHLLAAGRAAEALEPLLASARERVHRGDLRDAAAMIVERERVLAQLGVPEHDARWGEGWCVHADVEALRGRAERAHELALRAEALARASGDSLMLGRALLARARVEVRRGRFAEAEEGAAGALEAFAGAGRDASEEAILALVHLGMAQAGRGELALAEATLVRALARAREQRCEEVAAIATYELACVRRRRGEHASSRATYEDARARFRALGMRAAEANAIVGLGEVERAEGRYERAEALYREAIDLYEAVGSGNARVARQNLGLALLARGAWGKARHALERALFEHRRDGWETLAACAEIEVSVCDAALGDFRSWDERVERASKTIAAARLVDPDLAWAAEASGDHARAAGHGDRAKYVWSIAREQWIALGHLERAAIVEAKMRGA
ncbi:MAG TPA: tetratricopeptide repeat protein, partial [Sandaracinaceae bacterium]